MSVFMKCGHTAQGQFDDGSPVCAICLCEEVADVKPILDGRRARCSYFGLKCHSESQSKDTLPFFKFQPSSEYDTYYCGCYGWD